MHQKTTFKISFKEIRITSQMLYQTERTYPLNQKKFNPITHRILRFRQLWKGGGAFGMDPENMVTVNELI